MSKSKIANLAFNIENSQRRFGKQDQFITSLGGVRHLLYYKNLTKIKETKNIKKKLKNYFKIAF